MGASHYCYSLDYRAGEMKPVTVLYLEGDLFEEEARSRQDGKSPDAEQAAVAFF